MEKKMVFWLLTAIAALFVIVLLIPSNQPEFNPELLPWNITANERGHNRVVGLVLGESTLAEARRLFRSEGETALFVEPDGSYFVEAYLRGVSLNGLKADLVLNLDLEQSLAAQMFDRGGRLKRLESGNQRVDLASEDQQALAGFPVRSLTLVPGSDLDEELLLKRFGEPTSRQQIEGKAETHWRYPDRGLEIVVDPEGKELFQYVNPGEFSRLSDPEN